MVSEPASSSLPVASTPSASSSSSSSFTLSPGMRAAVMALALGGVLLCGGFVFMLFQIGGGLTTAKHKQADDNIANMPTALPTGAHFTAVAANAHGVYVVITLPNKQTQLVVLDKQGQTIQRIIAPAPVQPVSSERR